MDAYPLTFQQQTVLKLKGKSDSFLILRSDLLQDSSFSSDTFQGNTQGDGLLYLSTAGGSAETDDPCRERESLKVAQRLYIIIHFKGLLSPSEIDSLSSKPLVCLLLDLIPFKQWRVRRESDWFITHLLKLPEMGTLDSTPNVYFENVSTDNFRVMTK